MVLEDEALRHLRPKVFGKLRMRAIAAERETLGRLRRERRIERLRRSALDALAVRDHKAALGVADALVSFYEDRPGAAGADRDPLPHPRRA